MSHISAKTPSSLTYPDRLYLLSDTYGGHETWDPLKSPDIDAHIATDIRSRITGVRREFDIFGAENLTDHVLRTALALHDEQQDAGTTGIFINSAPRTDQNSNGKPFYVAETDNGVRIVATPIEALSPAKKRIVSLHHLPHKSNKLYDGSREQFRSSFTPVLLAEHHDLPLVVDNPSIIPDSPAGCRVAYADRFGNLILYSESITGIRAVIREWVGATIELSIGEVACHVIIDTSLSKAKPGSLVAYGNDGHIEVVSKWPAQWSAEEKLKNSAFEKFGRPKIGALVSLVDNYLMTLTQRLLRARRTVSSLPVSQEEPPRTAAIHR